MTPDRKQEMLPGLFALLLALTALFPRVRANRELTAVILGMAAMLLVWNAGLFFSGRKLSLQVVLRRQHYLQACAQLSVYICWGWYWPPVYAFAPLMLAQILFAYGFDFLLAWSRRGTYTLGFGIFPIVFSTNLFLWFRDDWFYLQFLMIALGLIAKETIRWNKEGRSAHIFNPSSFPLAVASIVLLAAGATGITWGREIATTQFYPPHMYLFLFLVGLPGQFFFGVTTMTLSAVVSTYLFGAAYFAATGIYFFYDSYIPIAVFLGMHLLFTDPSTSPKTEYGRILYGVMYGLSTVALYEILGMAGLPTFYDKLLQVPLLNLSVRWIDRLTKASPVSSRSRNLAYMTTWVCVFAGLSAIQGVGDNHPGQWAPFWRQACQQGRAFACPYLADLDEVYCDRGSGWGCNEAGLMDIALSRSGEDLRRTRAAIAEKPFRAGCELGFQMACRNLQVLQSGSEQYASAPPGASDLPILVRGSKGEVKERDPAVLQALACKQGWPGTCARR